MSKGFQIKAAQARQQIKDLYLEGKSHTEIMEIVGCSLSHVQHMLGEWGLAPRMTNTKVICQVIAALQGTVDTYEDIADRLKVSRWTVGKVAREASDAGVNYPPRKLGRPRTKTKRKDA